MSVIIDIEEVGEYFARERESKLGRIITISSETSTDQEIDIESHLICGICYFPLPPSAKRFPIDFKDYKAISHIGHPSRGLSSYESSMQRGCEACRQIVSKTLQLLIGTAEKSASLEICETLKASIGHGRSFVFHLFITEPKELAGKSLWQQLNQKLSTGTENCGNDRGSEYLNYYLTHHASTLLEDSYTGSEEISSRINTWLRECQMDHPSCQPSENRNMPRRILELDIHRNFFRLLEVSAETYSYACLSHRWSESTKNVILTQANSQQRKSWTSIDSLPRLFRDVISVVTNAGLKYLWIDCLCIIQDSDGARDWHREAAKMASIYENATFTVVATWCWGSDQSLFSTVDEAHQPVPVGSATGAVLRVWPEHPDLWGDKEGKHLPDFPLLGRGWVLQEVVLSKKLLLFGKNEIYWICRQASWCLCGITNTAAARVGLTRPAEDLMDLPWTKIITRFASMDLSFPSDKLPAIAGIASRYGTRHNLTYVAGHWKENLGEELLWVTDGGFEGKSRPHPVVAPTWSWASTDGSIEYESSTRRTDDQQLSSGIEMAIQWLFPLGLTSTDSCCPRACRYASLL